MKTRKILVIFFFLGLCTGLFAQNKGVVYGGKTIQRLEGVNIYLHKDTVGIGITDKEGEFDIKPLSALAEEDTLTFSYVGYETLKISLEKLKKMTFFPFLRNLIEILSFSIPFECNERFTEIFSFDLLTLFFPDVVGNAFISHF